MNNVLLDTSIIIDFLRRKDREKTLLAKLSDEDYHVTISIVTHAELFAGKSVWEDEALYSIIEKLCTGFTIAPIDTMLSKKAGKLRAYYQISLVDSIIAATAIQDDCELATLNIKDFKNIPSLKLFEG